jgi:hypothetical protein
MGERDEIQVHRKQHEFNRHEQNNDVFTIQENANDADGK